MLGRGQQHLIRMTKKDGISPARRAEAILRRMEHVSRKGSNPCAKPNIYAYNTVLNAWSKSIEKGAAEKAEAILKCMELDCDIQPDVYSYTSVIDAYAKSKNAHMAAETLRRMENLYNATSDASVKPNIRSYTSVIHAFGRAGSDDEPNNPEQAEATLHRMEAMHDFGHHDDLKPDTVCFNAVINAFGWSTNIAEKAERAYSIYSRMMMLYRSGTHDDAKPDIVTCNSVLNACAYTTNTNELDRALNISITVYETFRDNAPEYGRLNHITFGHMIMACSNLIPLPTEGDSNATLMQEKRKQLVETIWWHSCEEGKVSSYVLSQLQNALSFAPEKFMELVGKTSDSFTEENKFIFDINDIPSEWTQYAGSDEARLKGKTRRNR